MTPLACVMCLIPPDAQQFAVPVAQATILVAPYVLRDRITAAVKSVRKRRRVATVAGSVELATVESTAEDNAPR
jgi:hypothetical protein